MTKRITVFDTTLRDGEQTPNVNLNISEKLEIARQLELLGVDVIEAGFPAASQGDFACVQAVAQSAHCCVAALCRTLPADILCASKALSDAKHPRLHLFIATSALHMEHKLRMTPEDVLRTARDSVAYAKTLCEDVQFSAEDASRSDISFLCKILEVVIDAGATTVNIPDTVGYATPMQYGALIAHIKATVPNIDKAIISVHCHNDLGLGVANTISGLQNGALQFEGTINGLGERAGNAALEEVIMALETRKDSFQMEHNLNIQRIYRTSRTVANLTSVPLPVCKAIVGENAFSHESGIHQHGMMADSRTYEIITPQSIGKPQSEMVLGKHSGRHAFVERLLELGLAIPPQDIEHAFNRFKQLSDHKKNITSRDLETLVGHRAGVIASGYALESFQLQSGNLIKSICAISLRLDQEELTESAIGDGPVDASFKAVERIIGGKWPLASYNIRAVTEGEDALGEVTVRICVQNKTYTGKGLASDVIEASIRAYVNAINRARADILAEEQHESV